MPDELTKGDVIWVRAWRGVRIQFTYKNWRGEIGLRRVEILHGAAWGVTVWHPEPQWFLKGRDLDNDEVRLFAMKDMIGVVPDAG